MIVPVGLLGLHKNISRVRDVTRWRMASRSMASASSRGTKTGWAPTLRTVISYIKNDGRGMMAWSPGRQQCATQHADDLVGAVAEDDIIGFDPQMLGQFVRQRMAPTIRVPMNILHLRLDGP